MSEINPNLDSENKLAQSAEPEEFGVEQNKTPSDPARSLRIGLIRLYYNYSQEIVNQLTSGSINENRAKELTAQVDRLSLADLGYEISKGLPIEMAKEIMGVKSFFGPQEVKKAFGIEITEKLPIIPFNQEELIRAKELGQFLVLRVDYAADGQPMTMKKIEQLMQPVFESLYSGNVMGSVFEGRDQEYFKADPLKLEWALTTHEEVPDSSLKTYLEQTEVLVEYLRDHVFLGMQMPKEFSDAIAEFEACKEDLRNLLTTEGAQKLSELSINQLLRPSPVEMFYDVMLYFQNTGEIIPDYSYTNAYVPNGGIVCFGMGEFTDAGAALNMRYPGFAFNGLGAMFSRNK